MFGTIARLLWEVVFQRQIDRIKARKERRKERERAAAKHRAEMHERTEDLIDRLDRKITARERDVARGAARAVDIVEAPPAPLDPNPYEE